MEMIKVVFPMREIRYWTQERFDHYAKLNNLNLVAIPNTDYSFVAATPMGTAFFARVCVTTLYFSANEVGTKCPIRHEEFLWFFIEAKRLGYEIRYNSLIPKPGEQKWSLSHGEHTFFLIRRYVKVSDEYNS